MTILIKPSSSMCNLNCKYCFYFDIAKNREVGNFGFMNDETASAIIDKALEFVDGGTLNFAFQGGEPMLIGLGFYQKFVEKVKEKNVKFAKVTYALQTNGTLLTNEFCEFIKANNFLVGISLDGKVDLHNENRLSKEGKGTFNKVMQGVDLLKKHKIDFNVLTVVTSNSKKRAKEIYNFLLKNGMNYMQFITCLEPIGTTPFSSGFAIDNDGYFEFYKALFSQYIADKRLGKEVYIREFENQIGILRGEKPELCGMMGHCECQLVVEGNGNCYPCDFFCEDKYLLGNINTSELIEMRSCDNAKTYLMPSYEVDEKCKKCDVAQICRGGCRRERDYFSNGKLNLNIYCDGRKRFFEFLIESIK